MNVIVAKFGGTSMANAAAMQKSASIVARNPNIRVVVVSATSGTSNKLIEIYNFITTQDSDNIATGQNLLRTLQSKHNIILEELSCSSQLLYKDRQKIQNIFARMDDFADQIIQNQNEIYAKAQQLDQFLSFGEELSAHLFTFALRTENIDSDFFDIQNVLITDNHFGKAEPILVAIAQNTHTVLKPVLLSGKVQVVQGFVGSTLSGETTTLGRGGSDFSAALLAESLEAEELQIWTDVPGIMTMDPNSVPQAKIIPKMNFAVAAELANFGAKVLHPETIWPAMRKNIKTFVGSTFTPELGGTWIYPEHHVLDPILAIALRKKQLLITVNSLRMLNAHGFLAKLFGILAKNKLSVDLVTTSEVSVALTIDQNSLGSSGDWIIQYSKMFDEIREFCSVTMQEGLTLVAIIGTNLIKIPALKAKIFHTVADFDVRLTCYGASRHNLCFLVKEEDAIAVAQRLHYEFIESTL